jgi:hypothetical protein
VAASTSAGGTWPIGSSSAGGSTSPPTRASRDSTSSRASAVDQPLYDSVNGLAPPRSRERPGNVGYRGVLKRRRCAGQSANSGVFAGHRIAPKRIPKPRAEVRFLPGAPPETPCQRPLFVVLDSRPEPSGPVLVPSQTQARPRAVIAIARFGRSLLLDQGRRRVHGGVFPSCSRRDCVAPPSASAGARVSRRIARAAYAHTAASTELQSDPEGFVGRANQIESRRTFVERGETIPRSARQRVRLTACDLRPAARDPPVREESAERLPDPPQDPVHRRHERRETQRRNGTLLRSATRCLGKRSRISVLSP